MSHNCFPGDFGMQPNLGLLLNHACLGITRSGRRGRFLGASQSQVTLGKSYNPISLFLHL